MNKRLLSIVIPVYNAEKHIVECVASLECSKKKQIEILLVNDGSTDGSLAVCHWLEQENSNIRVIDSENKGVSAARNLGIQNAVGQWILFVDADDYLDLGAIDYIIKHLPQDEKIMCRFGMRKDFYRNNTLYKTKKLEHAFLFGKEEAQKKRFSVKDDFISLFENNVFDSACLCLFNRNVVQNNEIRFIEGMRVREDSEFVLHYLEIVDMVEVWNCFLYHYRIDGDEGYSLRRRIKIEDIERITYRYMTTLSSVRHEKSNGEKAIAYFVYQLFYGGVVHIATTNSCRYREIKKYTSIAMNNSVLYEVMAKANSQNMFHKILLLLFKRRCSNIFSCICCLRLR